ncbi:UMP kinase [Candidatus Bathyarchaeota archaeon]|nr:UMP kinase [Candidatus Bathyarchaeota archaeon]
MRLVIKAGGCLFPSGLDTDRIREFASVLKRLRRDGHSLIIVAGGGAGSRTYIKAARELGCGESFCDEVGIQFTRLNALLLISALGEDAYPVVPESVKELKDYCQSGRIVVMGGLQPGQSTNAVAAVAAEVYGAHMLINATDVDGVYTSDPKTHPDAERLTEVSVKRLLEIVVEEEASAGGYKLLDPPSVKIIARSRIPTIILNAEDSENIIRAVEGDRVGTRVTF